MNRRQLILGIMAGLAAVGIPFQSKADIREIEKLFAHFPDTGSEWIRVRMQDLKPGEVFRFTDTPNQYHVTVSNPRLIDDVWGVDASPGNNFGRIT